MGRVRVPLAMGFLFLVSMLNFGSKVVAVAATVAGGTSTPPGPSVSLQCSAIRDATKQPDQGYMRESTQRYAKIIAPMRHEYAVVGNGPRGHAVGWSLRAGFVSKFRPRFGLAAQARSQSVAYPLAPVQTAVATNVVTLAMVVGGAAIWGRMRLDSAENTTITRALVATVVASTGVQVASNILRLTVGGDGKNQGEEMSKDSSHMRKESEPGDLSNHAHCKELVGIAEFRWRFFSVLFVSMLAEFTQGVNWFNVYTKRAGLKTGDIGTLFGVSSLSSIMTGVWIGGAIDRYGRRNGCILWALLSLANCLLMHSKDIRVLILGRVIAGMSGNIIWTAFESWMVSEHHRRGYPSHMIAEMYRMSSWVISMATIAAGIVSDLAVRRGGEIAPFNVAGAMSVVAAILLRQLWKENYGSRGVSTSRHLGKALARITTDGRLLLMGIVQSLFDGAMAVWIVAYMASLAHVRPSGFPVGMVFSTLMTSIMGGTALFKLLTEGLPKRFSFTPEGCLLLATAGSAVVLGASATIPSFAVMITLFLLYEACIGMYSPVMGIMRSQYIPDDMRTTVMQLFRIPTHAIGLVMLFGPMSIAEADRRIPVVFGILAALKGIATLAQALLIQRERELRAVPRVDARERLPRKDK